MQSFLYEEVDVWQYVEIISNVWHQSLFSDFVNRSRKVEISDRCVSIEMEF